MDNWNGFLSPDYNSMNCNNSYRGIPINNMGISYAKHGLAFMGIISYVKTGEQKEYIYQQLSFPLIADSIYCLSFYVSRADYIPYAIKNIGAYFSTANPGTFTGIYIGATPQVVNQNGFITDTIGWTEIQGCFTAQGSEQYITIGNFNSNTNTDTLFVGTSNQVFGGNGYAYYFIDSVSLWQNNLPTKVNEFVKENKFSVWPNPTEGSLTLALSEGEGIEPKQCVIKITDVLGRENFVSEYKEQLNISALEKGIYFITILQGSKTLGVKKIIKQ